MPPDHTENSPVGRRWLTVAFVGITAGLMIVALVLAFASWIFSGPLGILLPLTTTLILAGTAVMNFISARTSSLPGSVLVPQDAPAAVLATTLSATVFTLADDARAGTALAIVAVSTLLTALVMLVLGFRRAGGLLRFVPVPVMGGFLGGTGWLLVGGAVDLARTGAGWTVPETANVAAAIFIGAALTIAIRRGAGAKTFPIVIAGAVVAFYAVLALTPISIAQARLDGFLPVTGQTVDLAEVSFGSVDWSVVVSALPRLLTIPVIATIALLMNVGGLELLARRDARLDQELITAGWGNMVGGALASPAGYPTLGISAVGFRIGIHSPAVPVLVGSVAAAAAVAGPRLVSGLPVAVAAGLIAMVGIGFLMDWVVDAFRRLPRTEYVLMLAIIVAVALFGFVVGVGLGMAAAVVLFTIKYSRLNPLRHTLTGRERTSSIDRSAAERHFLATHGHEILVAEVQGFLFFGTAHKAVKIVEERIKGEPLRFVIADMRRVEGIDSTAAYAFRRLAQIATDHSVALVYSDNADALAGEHVGEEEAAGVTYMPDLDRALEWCEDRILADFERPEDTDWIIEGSMWERLEPWMDRLALDDGEVLADMGDDADCLFLVGEGRVAVELPTETDRWRRVGSMGRGSMLGELALYSDGGRSARLSAEGPAVVYRLTPEAVSDLEANDPACAVAFHRSVASVIAERLKVANDSVQALIR